MSKYFYRTQKIQKLDRIGAPFRIFQHPLLLNIKKLKGKNFFLEKKSHNAEKTERGHFSLSRYCMLRGKKGKTVLVQFARTNDAICDHKISQNF